MSRYKLFTDKLVNELLSPHQRGRRHTLWLQSILYPAQLLNSELRDFIVEKKIEAHVTSQVLHFTWYLNRRFSQYFLDSNDKIKILHYVDLGIPYYSLGEDGETPNVVYAIDEDLSESEIEGPIPFFWEYESLNAIGASFKLLIPEITINENEFNIMLVSEVEKYRVAGKTYVIEYKI